MQVCNFEKLYFTSFYSEIVIRENLIKKKPYLISGNQTVVYEIIPNMSAAKGVSLYKLYMQNILRPVAGVSDKWQIYLSSYLLYLYPDIFLKWNSQ